MVKYTIEKKHGKYTTIIDEETYNQYFSGGRKWQVDRDGYVIGWIDKKYQRIHRVITKAPSGMVVDHINGNTLDNRLSNLRVCTYRQNNTCKSPSSLTGKKGVVKLPGKRKRPYQARIKIDGKAISLGTYETIKEAGNAYSKAAVDYFGEYAYIN